MFDVNLVELALTVSKPTENYELVSVRQLALILELQFSTAEHMPFDQISELFNTVA